MQVVGLPLIAYSVARAFGLAPGLFAGLMLVAASPGGVTSNYASLLARGAVGLSVSMTVVTSLLAPLTLPLVLAALAADLGMSDGEALAEGRGEQGYQTVDAFKQEPALNAKQIDDALFGVQSRWFLMVSQADIGQGRARLASLIQRTDAELRVVRRQREFLDTVTVPVDDDE